MFFLSLVIALPSLIILAINIPDRGFSIDIDFSELGFPQPICANTPVSQKFPVSVYAECDYGTVVTNIVDYGIVNYKYKTDFLLCQSNQTSFQNNTEVENLLIENCMGKRVCDIDDMGYDFMVEFYNSTQTSYPSELTPDIKPFGKEKLEDSSSDDSDSLLFFAQLQCQTEDPAILEKRVTGYYIICGLSAWASICFILICDYIFTIFTESSRTKHSNSVEANDFAVKGRIDKLLYQQLKDKFEQKYIDKIESQEKEDKSHKKTLLKMMKKLEKEIEAKKAIIKKLSVKVKKKRGDKTKFMAEAIRQKLLIDFEKNQLIQLEERYERIREEFFGDICITQEIQDHLMYFVQAQTLKKMQ